MKRNIPEILLLILAEVVGVWAFHTHMSVNTRSTTITKTRRRECGRVPTLIQFASDEQDEASGTESKRKIEITSEVELPFSPDVAYDYYSDLTRQPTWTSWLNSVEYLDDSKENTKWTLKFLGLKYSWTAVAVANERPNKIQWKSTSGVQNFGTVLFLDQENAEMPTIMKMKMTFVAPRAASALFRRTTSFTNFVDAKMITSSMVSFRDFVVDTESNQQE